MKLRYPAFLLFALLSKPASADTLYAGVNNAGSITRLGRGVKELGLDSMLVVSFGRSSAMGARAGFGVGLSYVF
jgi:hypothetical protein